MHCGSEWFAYDGRRPITGLAWAWLQLGGQFVFLSEAFFLLEYIYFMVVQMMSFVLLAPTLSTALRVPSLYVVH